MSQLEVWTFPEKMACALSVPPELGLVSEDPPPPLMEQPGPVCSATLLEDWVFTPSMISISPDVGQFGPTVQNAGHVPHVEAGMCSRSSMIRAWLYTALEVIRTDFRPRPEATFSESTPM